MNTDAIFNIDKIFDDDDLTHIYVIPLFMKPGKQHYVVSYPRKEQFLPTYYTHQLIIKRRDEDPPAQAKQMKTSLVQRSFSKQNSVFNNWKEDTDEIVQNAMIHDTKLWSLNRFVKDEEEREKVVDVVKLNAAVLKNAHIQASSRGDFPYVQWGDFRAFCERAGVIDKKNCPGSAVDRVFITVEKVDPELMGAK